MKTATRNRLARPVETGEPITYWEVGATAEQRYDVPDQPMHGEMDPFFFLTKHKNFIPHEYPCRTQFAAERRGKRPVTEGRFALDRRWLPFGSPRLDLSGFWFRPTIVGTWAHTILESPEAATARMSLRTCGGAVLFVNGGEIGWMAPYSRNLEAADEFNVPLVAGDNEILVWFDDLAERDARYYFQLNYLDGPSLLQALPAGQSVDCAEAIERALESMHFEEPAYTAGEVALVSASVLPLDAAVHVRIEGDFMSIDEDINFDFDLPAGATRFAIADVADLPADFRHFHVTLSAAGFSAGRVFGVELCDIGRQGVAPPALDARVGEALAEIAGHAEADTVRALARLAIGQKGGETDAMISAALPAIEDCHDCADFILVPLLWARKVYGDDLGPALRDRVDAAILGYRYWMDEAGNDVQWYFSENHALLFHTAAYMAGHMFPDGQFRRAGRNGTGQSAVGAARVRAWLDHFEAWEMAEFNSAPYFPIDLKGLTTLYALAPDADIRARAGNAIHRILEIVARSAHHGIMTGAQGRSYEHTLRASRTLELSGIARMLWGTGNYGKRFHALPQLALCIRDHGFVPDNALGPIAGFTMDGAQEWVFAQGQDRIAKLYHYKTRATAMGSAAAYRWDEWGYQETVLHVRLGNNPDATVWINHPGEVLHSGYGRPSYWGGSGTLPRLHQYRNLSVLRFKCHPEQPDFTHAWFPRSAFDKTHIDGDIALAERDGGFLMLKTDGPLELVATGPTAGNELRRAGHAATWIVRLATAENANGLDAFRQRFGALDAHDGPDGLIRVEDPEYGTVIFHSDGRCTAEGRTLDPSTWTVRGDAAFWHGASAQTAGRTA